jgi:HK97 family phage prohead protease
MSATSESTRPPRDGLVRAIFPGVELRDAGGDAGPVMAGHFAVFNQWTEIDSIFEGRFMEQFAPGAFKKTIRENRDGMRVLFQHGGDPQLGDKPLGPIETLEEDRTGAYYEVPLLDASYVRDNVLPGLRAGLYGASFRFRVMREEIVDEPKASAANPHGLAERTVKEAQVMEFGPVTFPAYDGASAGVRSLTDRDFFDRLVQDPERLRGLISTDAKPLGVLISAEAKGKTVGRADDLGSAQDALEAVGNAVELMEDVLDTVGYPDPDEVDPEAPEPAETYTLDDYNKALQNLQAILEVAEDFLEEAGFPDPDAAEDAGGTVGGRSREEGRDESPDEEDRADEPGEDDPAPTHASAEAEPHPARVRRDHPTLVRRKSWKLP